MSFKVFVVPVHVVLRTTAHLNGYFNKHAWYFVAAVSRIRQIITNGMRPKGARVPGALPLRPPGPQPPPGPQVPAVSFDQPPPLMSLNTAPSTVSPTFIIPFNLLVFLTSLLN